MALCSIVYHKKGWAWRHLSPQTNPDSWPRSALTLELLSRAASSVGVTSPFQRSQHRKQFWRRVDHKKVLTWFHILLNFLSNSSFLADFFHLLWYASLNNLKPDLSLRRLSSRTCWGMALIKLSASSNGLRRFSAWKKLFFKLYIDRVW